MLLADLRSKESQAWKKMNLKLFGYKSISTNQINSLILTGAATAGTNARLELNIKAAYLRNQELHVFGDFNMNFFNPAYKNID